MTRSIRCQRLDILRWLAFAALVAGIILVAVFVTARAIGAWERERGLQAFAAARSVGAASSLSSSPAASAMPEAAVSPPEREPTLPKTAPEGVLRIPALGIETPVFVGTDSETLGRGAGRVEWTPPLGSDGNVGVAAHRDGIFAALRRVSIGDAVLVEWQGGMRRYRVIDFYVVDPEDVHVLEPMGAPHVTLITCYPFDFVGAAPRRFIVHAQLTSAAFPSARRQAITPAPLVS